MHFSENNVLSYFVGEVQDMIACEHYEVNRLVVIMDLIEVETVQVSREQEDGEVFTTTLGNLWQVIEGGRTGTWMCPAWEIPHKTMLCRDDIKDYYCVYK